MRGFGESASGPSAVLAVHDGACFGRLLAGSDIGLGEAYTAGEWSSPDLVGLFRVLLANEGELADDGLLGVATRTVERLRNLLPANTRAGARRNVAAHYDLSNELYRLFLDETMTYSAAVFDARGGDLAEAQRRKYLRLAALAGLTPGMRVLEIGCGWGGFAEVAAAELGCHVTGLTLSTAQASFARDRLARVGLAGATDIRLEDYRDARGRYDAIVSIEMLEAVGHRYLGHFFAACERLLAPEARAAVQVITIPDQLYDRYRHGTDWIRKHVFPGGHLPSLGALQGAMAASSRLVVDHLDNLAAHYAETLRQWRECFLANRREVLALGFDERFVRSWELYLATCEALFLHPKLGTLQLGLVRPGVGPHAGPLAGGGR